MFVNIKHAPSAFDGLYTYTGRGREICVYAYTHIYIYTHTHIYVYIYICTHTHMYSFSCVNPYSSRDAVNPSKCFSRLFFACVACFRGSRQVKTQHHGSYVCGRRDTRSTNICMSNITGSTVTQACAIGWLEMSSAMSPVFCAKACVTSLMGVRMVRLRVSFS